MQSATAVELDEDRVNLSLKDIERHSPWYWTEANKIMLQSGPYQLEGHEYQIEMFNAPEKKRIHKKGAQLGVTQIEVLRTLHGLRYGKYPQGVLYLFPTADDVSEFSKARFNPLISDNYEAIGQYVHTTDSATIKRIGKALLYLRGARSTAEVAGSKKDSSKLRSIPVDAIRFDEVDLMDPDMVDLALERFSHSSIQEEVYLSTPTIPDFGIDKLYQASDQRMWMIKCQHCGEWTCLELEFPELIHQRPDGSGMRLCRKCKREIFPRDGQWCAQYPSRKDNAGWWISQLNSLYVDPWKILQLFLNPPNGNIQEVYNSKLGMAYIAAENRLQEHDLWPLCGIEPSPLEHEGPTCMGIDVGNNFHIVILDRPSDKSLRMVKAVYLDARINPETPISQVINFTPVRDLIRQYNTKSVVIDFAPAQQQVRALQEVESVPIFGCIYQEHQRGPAAWDEVNGIVRINRTEICDTTHDLCVTKGKFSIPRRSTVLDEWVTQMCNIAKVLEEDKETGSKVYHYRKLGPDHFRHALNYAVLASQRIGVYVPSSKKKGSGSSSWRKNDRGSFVST